MAKKARTRINEYEHTYAIELPGNRRPGERDRLTDQALVVAYERLPRAKPRWRLVGLHFDKDEWTRSGIRRWWATHEVHFLAGDQLGKLVPEVCRAYHSSSASVPTIVLCHRNTPLSPANQQMRKLGSGSTQTIDAK
jgi:hypothetical protein